MKTNKTHRFIAIFMMFILFFVPNAYALNDPNPAAAAAILIDKDSGYVLYDKNSDEKRYPASTTNSLALSISCSFVFIFSS